MGHLRPGGGGGIAAVQLAAQNALRPQVAQIRRVGSLILTVERGGALLRISREIQAANTAGEDQRLPNRHGILGAEGAVRFANRKAVLIQGGHIVIKNRGLAQIGKLPGIGPNALGLRGFRGQGRRGQKETQRQQQRKNSFFQDGTS